MWTHYVGASLSVRRLCFVEVGWLRRGNSESMAISYSGQFLGESENEPDASHCGVKRHNMPWIDGLDIALF